MSSLLLRRVRLVPLAPDDAWTTPDRPVDVLVEDGRVVAVGPEVGRPAGVPEIDAEGRWVLPGLWDAHTHLGQWAAAARRLDLSATTSRAEVLAAVEAALEPGTPLVGWGHRAFTWEEPASVADLDAVTGDTPVVLINADCHHGWLNSSALVALGLPPRPATGDPAEQVVSESEWFAVYPHLDRLDTEATVGPAAYRTVLERAASLGVVGLVDFEFGAPISAWAERWGQGCDLLRLRQAVYADALDDVLALGMRTGHPLVPADDRLTLGSLKIISDGSLGTRTAWCCEPYADAPANHGAPNLEPRELHDLVARAAAGGLTVATHAIGDRAVREALAAYAATGAAGSVEHAQLVTRDDVAELARLGLVASVQPAHLLDDRDLTEEVWPGRAERSFALRWMQDAGVRMALGSDAPVAPLDPWLAVAAAVRRSPDGADPWHPEQALTPQEALAASVDGAPTVGAGSLGDLVLVDHDPLQPASLDRIRSGPVALTVVGGQVVHTAL